MRLRKPEPVQAKWLIFMKYCRATWMEPRRAASAVRTLAELRAQLTNLAAGKTLPVFYSDFDHIWPSGWEDEDSRRQAMEVAKEHNCVIDEYAIDRLLGFRKL